MTGLECMQVSRKNHAIISASKGFAKDLTVTNEGSFFCRKSFSFFWYIIQNFEKT